MLYLSIVLVKILFVCVKLNKYVYVTCIKYIHYISYPIISYHILSYPIISYHILSYHIISYHIICVYIFIYIYVYYNIIYSIYSFKQETTSWISFLQEHINVYPVIENSEYCVQGWIGHQEVLPNPLVHHKFPFHICIHINIAMVITIWRFPLKIGVLQIKWMVFVRENPI